MSSWGRGSISYRKGDRGLRKQRPEISLSSFVIKEIFYNFVARFGLCILSVNLVTFKSPRSLSCPLLHTSCTSVWQKKLLFISSSSSTSFFAFFSECICECSSFFSYQQKKNSSALCLEGKLLAFSVSKFKIFLYSIGWIRTKFWFRLDFISSYLARWKLIRSLL